MQINTQYHKVLERQLRKVFGKGNDIPENILVLLELVSHAYEQHEQEKDLLNNTMDVGMRELAQANSDLINQKIALENTYKKLVETENKLSVAEQISTLIHEVEQKNAQLLSSEEELKQNLEELQTAQEHLQTKQKALATALSENKAITKALDNSAIVSITDNKGKINKVNDAFCQVSGHTAEELIGKNHQILNSGHHSTEFWTQMWQSITQGSTWRAEVCNKAKDGSLYWIDSVINPVYDEQGNIHQYLSIAYLINKRKKAEAKIQEQNQILQQNLEEVTVLKESGERLLKNVTDSINYARRIQNAIMPKEIELQKHLDCFVFYRPKDIVSGDFYWFGEKYNKKVIAVADCTGHGVPGAFMTMIANNILNQIVLSHGFYEPNEILDMMPILLEKTLLHSEGTVKDGMDISIVTIYKEEKKIAYAGAKNSLYYVKNKEFNEIRADRVPIGGIMKDDFSYRKHELQFEQESCAFYMFSDGFQDQFGGEKRRKFMSNNFRNLLSSIADKPMETQKNLLEIAFDQWRGDNKQTDDVLVVGVRI
ncbi:MAG: PAS domain S-box protein [Bacteroidetes bacterium]|nr:MAG: PAS domain S-box protein [Bacteroidota bacterium]